LGSIEAAMAVWLKGGAAGKAIAGSDPAAHDRALKLADGNGTTVGKYFEINSGNLKKVNINKQLPFLEEVEKRNPEFDWSILDKEISLYSPITLRRRQAGAERRHTKAAQRHTSRRLSEAEQKKLGYTFARIGLHEFHLHKGRNLETQGWNKGPVVQRYTHGREESWCSDFISYLHKKAGHPFIGAPANADHTIPLVKNEAIWFKKHGRLFGNRSRLYTPRPGDAILFNADDKNTGDDHTGEIVWVKGDSLGMVEGNTSLGSVGFRIINRRKPPARHIAFGRVTRR
jgi:hypothetical protein